VTALLVFGVNLAVYNVNTLTLRQVVTPNRLLARMNASYRLILFGAAPIGAVFGGTMADLLGLRTALVIAVIGVTTPLLWIFFSPVFRLKDIPTAPIEPSDSEANSAPPPAPAATDVSKDRSE
jgi:hypothetical protein